MENYESFEFDATLIKALDHDIRRKILLEIFENGLGGYSELTRVLKLKSGVFYHHMRLLEEANLVQQLSDKSYDITQKGVQSIEFFSQNFVPVTKSKLELRLNFYNKISNLIDFYPLPSLIFQSFIIVLGLIWLSFFQQIGLIGYFMVSVDQIVFLKAIFPIVILLFFLINQILLYGYCMSIIKRSARKIDFIGQILFPQTIVVFIVVIFSLIPPITNVDVWALGPLFGLILTMVFQIFSITYYLHILRKLGIRTLDKAVIGLLLLQYWNLLILYIMF